MGFSFLGFQTQMVIAGVHGVPHEKGTFVSMLGLTDSKGWVILQ